MAPVALVAGFWNLNLKRATIRGNQTSQSRTNDGSLPTDSINGNVRSPQAPNTRSVASQLTIGQGVRSTATSSIASTTGSLESSSHATGTIHAARTSDTFSVSRILSTTSVTSPGGSTASIQFGSSLSPFVKLPQSSRTVSITHHVTATPTAHHVTRTAAGKTYAEHDTHVIPLDNNQRAGLVEADTMSPTHMRDAVLETGDHFSTIILVSRTSTQLSAVVTSSGSQTLTSSAAVATVTDVIPSTVMNLHPMSEVPMPSIIVPSPSVSPSPSGALSSGRVPAVAGGVVGPLALLGLIFLALFIRRRRAQSIAQKHDTINSFSNHSFKGSQLLSPYPQSNVEGAPSLRNSAFNFNSPDPSEPDAMAYQIPEDQNPFRDPKPTVHAQAGVAL